MDLQEGQWGCKEWTDLAQDSDVATSRECNNEHLGSTQGVKLLILLKTR